MTKPAGDQGSPEASFSFEIKRAIVGGFALACLLLAGLIYAASPDPNNFLFAACIRVGIVLFACWLALPQLRGILSKVPDVLPVIALIMLVFCAARPNLFRIVGSLVVVGGALIAISKWIKSVTAK